MKRRLEPAEIKARVDSGDRTLISWLRSNERREELYRLKTGPGTRLLSAYWRKALANDPALNLVLNLGCGVGTHAVNLLQSGQDRFRFVGMDYDYECIKLCRKKLGAVASFQFHPVDYLRPTKFPRRFDYIAVTHLFHAMPLYREFVTRLWEKCDKGLIILLAEPATDRPSDVVFEDATERRCYHTLSAAMLEEFCGRLSSHTVYATAWADNSQDKEHVVLLRRDATVADFSDFYLYTDANETAPYVTGGLQ